MQKVVGSSPIIRSKALQNAICEQMNIYGDAPLGLSLLEGRRAEP